MRRLVVETANPRSPQVFDEVVVKVEWVWEFEEKGTFQSEENGK